MISYCPNCGLKFAVPISETDLRQSFNICDCCGCEYGYDDTVEFRQKWLENGATWFNPAVKPAAWDLNEQIKQSVPSWNECSEHIATIAISVPDHSQTGSSLNSEDPITETINPID